MYWSTQQLLLALSYQYNFLSCLWDLMVIQWDCVVSLCDLIVIVDDIFGIW
jgi:hypothetical protein